MEQVSETKEKVETYLKARFPQRKDLSVAELDRITGGVSHILFSCTITWQEGQDTASETMVFRILPDIGACPPYDIRPQYEAMTRVRGTGIPVPRVYWLEMDSRILDNPFFVMEKVEGESLLGIYNRYPELKDRLNQEFIDCLVKIHQLDWSALGLSVLGVPENNRQYAESEIFPYGEMGSNVKKDRDYEDLRLFLLLAPSFFLSYERAFLGSRIETHRKGGASGV